MRTRTRPDATPLSRSAGQRTAIVATAMVLALIGAAVQRYSGRHPVQRRRARPRRRPDDHAAGIGAEDDRQGRAPGHRRRDGQGAARARGTWCCCAHRRASSSPPPARRRSGGRTASHRRHPLPDRVDHQDDDVGGDPAARPGGQAQPRRPGVEIRPGRPRRRQHHHRPAAGDAQRAVQLHQRTRDRRRVSTTTRPRSGSPSSCWTSPSPSRPTSRPARTTSTATPTTCCWA